MASTRVIVGEASETDSDEEIDLTDEKPKKDDQSSEVNRKVVYGRVVSGEASESDDDTPKPSTEQILTPPVVVSSDIFKNSLLHRKLRENNIALHAHIIEYSDNLISNSRDDLIKTDQQLLKSQITLQNAITGLQQLRQYSFQLNKRLEDVVTANFLPNIINPQ